MSTTERAVTVNHDQELYVIHHAVGFSALGFDVCLGRVNRILLELDMRGVDAPDAISLARGDLRTYDTYMILSDMLQADVKESGEPAICGLSPQLVGLEGHRVQVLDKFGEERNFIVGKSTGWMPCHLEIRHGSSGGHACDMEYAEVEDLGPVR